MIEQQTPEMNIIENPLPSQNRDNIAATFKEMAQSCHWPVKVFTHDQAINKISPISFFQCRLDQLADDLLEMGLDKMNASYKIAYCSTSTNHLDPSARLAVNLPDEIWVRSHDQAEIFKRYASCPVQVIPPAIKNLTIDNRLNRSSLGIAQEDFVFMTSFDPMRGFFRKNVSAALDYFKRAFPAATYPSLKFIIKTRHFEQNLRSVHEAIIAKLRVTIASDERFVFMYDDVSDGEMNALLQIADCYVDLSHATALGQTNIEAMWLGTPLLTTSISGRIDYANSDTAFVVSHTLCDVVTDDFCRIDDRVHRWADANAASVIDTMQKIVANPAVTKQMGLSGQNKVKSLYDISVTAPLLRQNLERIQKIIARDRS
jgi:glycosyltransferase involved in cell wall biosynthesis